MAKQDQMTLGLLALSLISLTMPLQADPAPGPSSVSPATLARDLKASAPAQREQAYQRMEELLRPDAPEQARQTAQRLLVKHCEDVVKQHRAIRNRVEAIVGRTTGPARERALTRWIAARDEARQLIFDDAIYPKADHGKAGQRRIDAKVAEVREAFLAIESLESTDTRGWSSLTAREATAWLEKLDDCEMMYQQASACARPQHVEIKAALDPAPTAWRAFLLYQAGRCAQARALLSTQSAADAWSERILARLELLRVRRYNESLLSAPPGDGCPQEAELRQVSITNDYRYLLGQAPLEIDPALTAAARAHGREMARLRYVDHFSPTAGRRTPGDRCRAAGYQGRVAENLHVGRSDPRAVHDAFFNSSEHHRILLGAEYRSIGVGQFRDHWVQDFGSTATLER